jgi:hypothetical protein
MDMSDIMWAVLKHIYNREERYFYAPRTRPALTARGLIKWDPEQRRYVVTRKGKTLMMERTVNHARLFGYSFDVSYLIAAQKFSRDENFVPDKDDYRELAETAMRVLHGHGIVRKLARQEAA